MAHSQYFNSNKEEVPSVTTILKILDKPHLSTWANRMGFKHIRVEDVLEQTSYYGTTTHEMIEKLLKGEEYEHKEHKYYSNIQYELTRKNVENMISMMKLEPIHLEFKGVTDKYGGTLDFYGMSGDIRLLLDFKTSKRPYKVYRLQLGGYYNILKESGIEVDRAGIANVNTAGLHIELYERDKLEEYGRIFDKLVDIYHNLKKEGLLDE